MFPLKLNKQDIVNQVRAAHNLLDLKSPKTPPQKSLFPLSLNVQQLEKNIRKLNRQ